MCVVSLDPQPSLAEPLFSAIDMLNRIACGEPVPPADIAQMAGQIGMLIPDIGHMEITLDEIVADAAESERLDQRAAEIRREQVRLGAIIDLDIKRGRRARA